MNIYHEHLMFFGAYFPVLLAIGQLLQKRKSAISYIYAFSFLTMGMSIFHICSYSTGILPGSKYINLLFVSVAFISAPIMGLRYRWIIGKKIKKNSNYFFLFIPAIIAFTLSVFPLISGNIGIREEHLISCPLFSDAFSSLPVYYKIIQTFYFLSKPFLILIMLPALVSMSVVWNKQHTGSGMTVSRIGYVFAVLIVISTGLAGAGDLVSVRLIHWAVLFINATFSLVFLATQLQPDYSTLIKTETRKAHYMRSKIKGLDVPTIITRLNEMMEDEKVYALEGLTIGQLASELQISQHQLSQIINEKLHKNFNSYINEYRIEEAKKMLIEEPERSISSVGFATGFNSNTNFSTVFLKYCKCSPSEYRKTELKERGLSIT